MQTPSEVDAIDEREKLFNAYLDGEFSDEEQVRFEERLEDNPELRAAYEEFAEFVGELRSTPRVSAPEDFSEGLRDRIRTRSNGRFFTDNLRYRRRPPQELAAAAMLVIMASAYLVMGLSMDRHIDSPTDTRLEVPARALGE